MAHPWAPGGLSPALPTARWPQRGASSPSPFYLSFTNEMINTFNLEQNLLTFPSERDVIDWGWWEPGCECGTRWMARCWSFHLARPRRAQSGLPSQPRTFQAAEFWAGHGHPGRWLPLEHDHSLPQPIAESPGAQQASALDLGPQPPTQETWTVSGAASVADDVSGMNHQMGVLSCRRLTKKYRFVYF